MREMTVLNKSSFKIRESSGESRVGHHRFLATKLEQWGWTLTARGVCVGPQLKSILRHTISMDLRDEPVFPTHGVWMQISNEVAGLGGSVANLKAELRLQANHTISQQVGIVSTTHSVRQSGRVIDHHNKNREHNNNALIVLAILIVRI